MMSRVEWFEWVWRHGTRKHLGRQVIFFIAFEAYYQFCKLRGYRPRHVLEPEPAVVRSRAPGERVMAVWPRLPLSIRFLNCIFPPGRLAFAEFLPYSPEAAAAARASGRRVAVVKTVQGELEVMRT